MNQALKELSEFPFQGFLRATIGMWGLGFRGFGVWGFKI